MFVCRCSGGSIQSSKLRVATRNAQCHWNKRGHGMIWELPSLGCAREIEHSQVSFTCLKVLSQSVVSGKRFKEVLWEYVHVMQGIPRHLAAFICLRQDKNDVYVRECSMFSNVRSRRGYGSSIQDQRRYHSFVYGGYDKLRNSTSSIVAEVCTFSSSMLLGSMRGVVYSTSRILGSNEQKVPRVLSARAHSQLSCA